MQQLTFFGKRRRPGRGSPEFNLHVMVADILRRWATTGWRWTHLPFGEYRGDPERAKITGGRLKRMGTQRGWPDFILCSPYPPKAHFLELKRKGGQLTDEQAELMEWFNLHEYPYAVADNFVDAVAILKDWGAVRASVSA
jgi:hypothetical protein